MTDDWRLTTVRLPKPPLRPRATPSRSNRRDPDGGPRLDDRQIEADPQSGTLRQLAQLPRNHFGGFANDHPTALTAKRPPDAREQQAHVIVDLGRRPDGRSRVAYAVLLSDRDRRR